jgi:hypothetical protein
VDDPIFAFVSHLSPMALFAAQRHTVSLALESRPARIAQLVEHFHGKEGVTSSSLVPGFAPQADCSRSESASLGTGQLIGQRPTTNTRTVLKAVGRLKASRGFESHPVRYRAIWLFRAVCGAFSAPGPVRLNPVETGCFWGLAGAQTGTAKAPYRHLDDCSTRRSSQAPTQVQRFLHPIAGQRVAPAASLGPPATGATRCLSNRGRKRCTPWEGRARGVRGRGVRAAPWSTTSPEGVESTV